MSPCEDGHVQKGAQAFLTRWRRHMPILDIARFQRRFIADHGPLQQ